MTRRCFRTRGAGASWGRVTSRGAAQWAAAALLATLPGIAQAQSPAGTEFQVNAYTTSQQAASALALDASGNFVVVWNSQNQDGSAFGVFGQRFDAAGVPQGGEFQVNSYTTSNQFIPAVAADAAGNFVVVWSSSPQDTSAYGVFGQRFNASGVPQGSEFQVNAYTTGNQSNPAVAADAAGNFVAVWSSFGPDGNFFGVVGRRFDATGVPQGSEFQVNSHTTSNQFIPALAADAAGNFVVVWQSLAQDGSAYGVFGQRFNASGVPQGSEFQVNSYTTSAQNSAAVAADAAGNFVVVWSSSTQDTSADGVFGQRFNASGVPQGSEFQVNIYTTGSQSNPAVAADADGNFVVVWNSDQDGSGSGIVGRRFDASGVPHGSEFQVNSHTASSQFLPAVASNPDGAFVVAWQSHMQDGDGEGIFGQRFGSDLIFQDGFESGDMSRWSSTVNDGFDLDVSGAAALAGTTVGLQAVVDDANPLYVQDDRPNSESRYRARFYFDPNDFDPGISEGFFRVRIFIALNAVNQRLITLVLRRQGGSYALLGRVRRDDGSRADTGFFGITAAPHFVELDWQRSSAPGANDGQLIMRIDDVEVSTLSAVDNDSGGVDFARMGVMTIKTAAASGTMYFDQFESRREFYIGPE